MSLSVETQNKMRIHGANSKVLREIPTINKQSDWNPLSSNLYKSLRAYQDCKRVEPWVVDSLNNMSLLMNSLAVELGIGNSVIGTLKMELLMRSYMSFCDSEARAATLSTEHTLSVDKQAKAHLMYKEAGNKALKTMFDILGELEGRNPELRNLNLHQNNININVNEENAVTSLLCRN
jgi:hypothetical protein